MPGLLKAAPPSDAARAAHDRHDHRVVILVLAVLVVYAYLFTYVADVFHVPRPQDLAESAGIRIEHVFDVDRNVDSNFEITENGDIQDARRARGQWLSTNDDERFLFLIVLAVAFVCAYYLPLRYKTGALVWFTILALGVLFGARALAGLLVAHGIVFLVLHPDRYVPDLLRKWLKHETVGPVARTVVIQSAIITVSVGALVQGLGGRSWELPAGILLFFWQWERLIMYHVDYKDGLIPAGVTPWQYLSVFFSPGTVPNWTWGVTIGQGYNYVDTNFYARDKNRIILGGVKLLGIALLYLVFWNVARYGLVAAFETMGVPVFGAQNAGLLRYAAAGHDIGTLSVLATSLLHLARWTMLWGGVVHVKVGIWRLCGYDVDPYFDKPWLSTNLVSFWSRFTFHYREFLVRAFYYPFFFRFFKHNRSVRVVAATVFAAGFANMVWGHMTERLFYRGMRFSQLLYVGSTWPYYLLLGLGIGLTQVYLLRVKRRKPWSTLTRFPLDVLATYCTLQFYALLDILHQADYTLPVRARVFLAAFGKHLSP
jgi:hypothetical protein